jgi:hypothetical protein
VTDIKKSVLLDIAEVAAIEEDSLRFDYSGHGMIGKECFGIVGDTGDLVRFVAEATEAYVNALDEGDTDLSDDLRPLYSRLDAIGQASMGRDYIFYWPQLQVVEG